MTAFPNKHTMSIAHRLIIVALPTLHSTLSAAVSFWFAFASPAASCSSSLFVLCKSGTDRQTFSLFRFAAMRAVHAVLAVVSSSTTTSELELHPELELELLLQLHELLELPLLLLPPPAVVGSCVHHVVVAGSSPSLVGPTVVGAAVVGDALVGESVVEAVVGDAVVGDAVVGEAVVGESVVGDAVVGVAVVGDGVPGSHTSLPAAPVHTQPAGSASDASHSAWRPHISHDRAHVNPTHWPALSPAPAMMQ